MKFSAFRKKFRINSKKPRSSSVLILIYSLLGPIAAFAQMGTTPLLLLSIFAHGSLDDLLNRIKRFLLSGIGASVIAFFLWGLISLFWSETNSFFTILRVLGTVIIVFLFGQLIISIPIKLQKTLEFILIFSFIFLLSVLLFESFSGSTIHKLIRPKDLSPRDGEWVPYIQLISARGTSILAPFSIVISSIIIKVMNLRILGIIFLIISLVVCYRLPMEASFLSICVGIIAYIFADWRPKLSLRILFLILVSGTLLSPVIVKNFLNTYKAESLGIEISRNQEQRLIIWEYTTGLINQKPILGFGFDSSRSLSKDAGYAPETNWSMLPLHPHNAFLQIHLELGFIGAIFFCTFLFLVFRKIEDQKLEKTSIALIVSTISSSAILALISFGIWQYWWISTLGLLYITIKMEIINKPNQ